MAQGNPNALIEQLEKTNPSFAQFMAQNRGKTPEQAFQENGFDYEQVKKLF